MSAGERVVTMCRDLGLPVTHLAWPESDPATRDGGAPPLPWFCWALEAGGETFADGTNWASLPRLVLELYERSPDVGLHKATEAAIQQTFGPFKRYESWAESEHCLMTAWHFTDTSGKGD